MKKNIRIREYNLSHERIGGEKPVCLAFFSDIHNCLSPKEQENIFALLEQIKPDAILLGGDVLVGKKGKPLELAYRFVEKVSELYQTFYVYGNHEQRICLYPEIYGNMGTLYEELIEKTKVIRVNNKKIDVTINQMPLTVCGLEADMRFFKKGIKPKGMKEELEQTFGAKEDGRYHILLAHNPRFAKEYLEWGANLTLSGHYHGGVLLLGKQLGAISPDYRILTRDCCGIRTRGESHMIVSAGLGEHTIPFRIHNPREITVIRLGAKKEKNKK